MIMKLDFSIKNIENIINKEFPSYKNFTIKEVHIQGNDNKTFYLGDTLLIRLPPMKDIVKQ